MTLATRSLIALLLSWPAHAATAADDDLGANVQLDNFQKGARRWMDQLDDAYGKGFFRYYTDDGVMPRPYVVAAQRNEGRDPETQEKGYAEILGHLYQQFFREYGSLLDTRDILDAVPVLVFDSKEAYEKVREDKPELGLADNEFIAGYYSPASGMLFQWDQPNLYEVMFHEGTHQLVDYCARQYNTPQFRESPWFQEGIAEYLGGHKKNTAYSETEGRFVTTFELGQFLSGRYVSLQRGLQSGDAYKLKDLTHMSFPDFISIRESQKGSSANQVKIDMVYAQGWGLVMFMHNYDDGAYRPMLDEYFQLELRGEGGGEAFAELFGIESDDGWEFLDEEFREYVFSELRQMRYKK